MPDVAELGQLAKKKWPGAYDQIPDAALGRLVKKKWPGSYDQFTDTPESTLSRVGSDLSIGFRSGVSHGVNTLANAAHLLHAEDTSKRLRTYAEKEAPSPSEVATHDTVLDKVAQGVGSAVPGIVENAPALLAKKYAPLAAGVIGTVGALDKGGYQALGQGVQDATSFYLLNKAGNLPTRTARTVASAGAMALPTYLTGGSAKDVAASAITGGVLGAVPGKPHSANAKKAELESVRSLKQDLRQTWNPTKLGTNAQKTGLIIIPQAAERAQRADRAEYALRQARSIMDKLPYDRNNPGGISNQALEFINHIETGNIQKIDPALRPYAQEIRRAFDQRLTEIQKHGLLNQYVENYFPHLFTRPEEAEKAFQIISKRPLEGGKKFLKQRTFMTVKDAMDFAKQHPEFGLKLASNNPIDIALLQLREQDKFITARNILQDMKKEKLLKFVRVGEKKPQGYDLINDKFATVVVPKNGTLSIIGHYYAPSDAARVMNNYLSPGMRQKPWFRTFTNAANALNMFQLGWSAYHAGFTTVEAAVSQFALATEKAIEGIRQGSPKLLAGSVKDFAKVATVPFEPAVAPTSLFKRLTTSNKMMQEWRKEGSHPEVARLVDLAKQAGARMDIDPAYRVDMWKNMQRSFHSGKILTGALGIPGALTEKVMMPIFEYIVPMQKIGAFHRLAEYEISKLNPNASDLEVKQAMQKAWKSIDNRFGQMVYDNLFWNKLAKDLTMASVRSVGWNFGTFNEIGGGLADWAKASSDLAHGRNIDITHRMAYTMALPVVVGMIGAMANWLMTGQAPQSTTDLYAPRTGKLDEYGNPERVWIPSYIKDVFAVGKRGGESTGQWASRLGGVAAGKLHPMLTTIAEMLENKDWRNGEIRHADDPWMKQVVDSAKFVADQVIPFAFRYSLEDQARRTERLGGHTPQYSNTQAVGAFFGMTPAPQVLKEHAYQIAQERYANRGSERHTKEQLARRDRKREMARALRKRDQKEYDRLEAEGIKRGEITQDDIRDVKETYALPPGVANFKHLQMVDALSVYFNYVNTDKSIPNDEKAQLRQILVNKILNGWYKIEQRPDGDPVKNKARQMLRLLNMMNGEGEITG